MRKLAILILSFLLIGLPSVQSAPLTGGVKETGNASRVLDAKTDAPIEGAVISIPQIGYKTKTDENGAFALNATVNSETIMSVQKEGYRPFSITIDKNIASRPMILGIQKSDIMDVVIDEDMIHLGDNTFSKGSANSAEFKLKAVGPTYVKRFKMTSNTLNYNNYLVIGSIIGVDTQMAHNMRQNNIESFSSPPEVFFNGKKIAEIKLNGDNQKIKLPKSLIRPDDINEVAIQTGINLFNKARLDYDDIEMMKLSVQTE